MRLEYPSVREKFAAAIFDMDGTLVETDHFHRRSWQEYLLQRGAPVSDAHYYARIAGRPGKNVLPEVLGLPPEESEAEITAIEKRYWELAAGNMHPLAGLWEFLEEISDRPKALATSARRYSALRTLEELELADRLDAVVTAEDITNGKPDPEVFLLAAERLGVEPERCLAFEDSVSGVDAARAAEMCCVGVATSHTPRELGEAHLVIRDFRDEQLLRLVS
jgi:sugar-phosphatase